MNIPEPTLIGYMATRPARRPARPKFPGVDEICSISECMNECPKNWISTCWPNEMWLYDNPQTAWSVVPDAEKTEFTLYAYRMYPFLFKNGQTPFNFPSLSVEPLDPSFRSLGLDVVNRSMGTNFECSALSCNLMAETIPVNRYCLLDSLTVAFELARDCRAETPPYCVIEVFRRANIQA
jgi:hypothetical protein